MHAGKERRNRSANRNDLLVRPGEIVIVAEAVSMMTVVGRGVAVCIWAPGSEAVAGMCHFMHPLTREAAKATASYGNVAVLTLIARLRERAPRASLEAQLFGGAVRRGGDEIGDRNIDIARRILQARGVRIVSEDVGGSKGRKVLFDSQSGHSAVLKVHQIRKEDWGE